MYTRATQQHIWLIIISILISVFSVTAYFFQKMCRSSWLTMRIIKRLNTCTFNDLCCRENLHCWYFLSLFQGPSGAAGVAGTKGPMVRPLAAGWPQQYMTSFLKPCIVGFLPHPPGFSRIKTHYYHFYKAAQDKITDGSINSWEGNKHLKKWSFNKTEQRSLPAH